MTSGTTGGDDNVFTFPKTAAERAALRKARQDLERQKLVNLFIVEAGSDALFPTADGVAFADLIVAGHRETWPIRSKQFRYEFIRYLKRQFEQLTEAETDLALTMGQSLKKSAVNAAIDEFEMQAICSRSIREVHVRVAATATTSISILPMRIGTPCASRRRAGRSCKAHRCVSDAAPECSHCRFPARGMSIDRLRPFLNINANDFVLVVAYLLAALRPGGPYPVLALIGEHGTAKTTLVRVLRSLIDPSTVPSSALPFSGRDLFIAAHNSHVQAFENVSKLSNAMSDYLCRLATGGGVRTRALFKDVDETLLRATRPIMLEGIANYITRADLMDRAIILALEPLTDRKTERVLQAEFERLRPGLFGALLDHLVIGIRQLPDTHLTSSPRMADFATWAVACGLDGFEQAYAANRQAAIDVVLEHDVLARAVRALVVQQREWQGNRERAARPLRARSPNPEREGLIGRAEPARAHVAHRRGRRAAPPDQRPARNHDRPAAVTQVTRTFRVVRHLRHRPAFRLWLLGGAWRSCDLICDLGAFSVDGDRAQALDFVGGPERTRTSDLRFRKPVSTWTEHWPNLARASLQITRFHEIPSVLLAKVGRPETSLQSSHPVPRKPNEATVDAVTQ